MAKFVKSDKIKIRILEILAKKKEKHSYYGLTKETHTSFSSILPACNFLQMLDFITIEEQSTTSRKYNFIKITRRGEEALELI